MLSNLLGHRPLGLAWGAGLARVDNKEDVLQISEVQQTFVARKEGMVVLARESLKSHREVSSCHGSTIGVNIHANTFKVVNCLPIPFNISGALSSADGLKDNVEYATGTNYKQHSPSIAAAPVHFTQWKCFINCSDKNLPVNLHILRGRSRPLNVRVAGQSGSHNQRSSMGHKD
jgi:hypothetical protein